MGCNGLFMWGSFQKGCLVFSVSYCGNLLCELNLHPGRFPLSLSPPPSLSLKELSDTLFHFLIQYIQPISEVQIRAH